MNTSARITELDVSSAAFVADRHAIYQGLRESQPVARLEKPAGAVLLTRHDDISHVLKGKSVLMRAPGTDSTRWLTEGFATEMNEGRMLFMDGEQHARVRRVVSPAFRPKKVDGLRGAVMGAVQSQINKIREAGEFDLVGDFAAVVPSVAICSILGVPVSDWDALIRPAADFVLVLSQIPLTPNEMVRGERACAFYHDYFSAVIEERRKRPRGDDDFVTILVRAHQDGNLTYSELLSTVHSVLNAGYETTMSGLANGLEAMLRYDGPWSQLCGAPALVHKAVEESLRWEAPVQIVSRYSIDDISLPSGEDIEPGTQLFLSVASANRDARYFADPDTFSLSRTTTDHLSFSAGRHMCIGAHLARMEMSIALEHLARSLPDISLQDHEAPRDPNIVFPTLQRVRATV